MAEKYKCPQCLTTNSMSLRTEVVTTEEIQIFVQRDENDQPQVVMTNPERAVDTNATTMFFCEYCNFNLQGNDWIYQLFAPDPPE